MITSLRLVNFKNFADQRLRAGPFTLIVGANASGKSNIRDAFRFVHGIGRGYALAEIIGGKYGAGAQVEWQAMRGGVNEIIAFGESTFTLEVESKLGNAEYLYSVEIGTANGSSNEFKILREELKKNSALEPVYTSHPEQGFPADGRGNDTDLPIRLLKVGKQKKSGSRIVVRGEQPALCQVLQHKEAKESHRGAIAKFIESIRDVRFLDLIPDQMRKPSLPGQTVLGDGGENLSSVLKKICESKAGRNSLISWVQELTPMDVADFSFETDRYDGKIRMFLVEANGGKISADSASDGTLRFLAMLAALLGGNPAQLYFFEELDNGIHPSRLRLLMDLIETSTAEDRGIQVIATTHSPTLLAWVGENTFQNTSVVYRSPDSNHSLVIPVAKIPDVARLRETQGLGELLATGWLEDAIAFTNGEDELGGGSK